MAAILKKRNKKYTTLKCAHASVVQTKSPSTDVVAAVVAYCVYPLKEKLSKQARKVVLRRPSSGAPPPHTTKTTNCMGTNQDKTA